MIVPTKHRSSSILLLLLVPALFLLAPAPADAQGGPLWDHYKVYGSTALTVSVPVKLTDQFGVTEHTVTTLDWFANPVQKTLSDGTGDPIFDPRTHYAWWRINKVSPGRIVIAENQFGSQTLTVKGERYLLNPALKDEQGPLPNENHYKCYDCVGDSVGVRVTMTDQFGDWSADVLFPRYFCNPVRKDIGHAVFPIVDAGQHYVCYDFTPEDPAGQRRAISDQFVQDRTVQLRPGQFLCVPTQKVDPTPTSTDTWGRLKLLYR